MLRKTPNYKNDAGIDNTGFGANSASGGGRFINKDGTPNVKKRGVNFFLRMSLYHSLLAMSSYKFLIIVLLFYTLVNLMFGSIYYLIGIEHLGGVVKSSPIQNFGEAFFFSAQTFTTVGYGRINPVGFLASAVAAVEALIGLLSFALATGLLYGRFAHPQAFLRFSDFALIAPYKGNSALMFRLAPYKNNNLLEAEVKVNLAIKVDVDGKLTNRFFPLELEISMVNALNLSWTVVHAITETSPLFLLTPHDFEVTKMEVLVFVKAFDESFSNLVVDRTSYTHNEILVGAKFKPMFFPSDDNRYTILDLGKLSAVDRVDLPERSSAGGAEEGDTTGTETESA